EVRASRALLDALRGGQRSRWRASPRVAGEARDRDREVHRVPDRVALMEELSIAIGERARDPSGDVDDRPATEHAHARELRAPPRGGIALDRIVIAGRRDGEPERDHSQGHAGLSTNAQ